MGRQPPAAIVGCAQLAEAHWNIPASVLIGQWALESGWGEHEPPSSNNPFGEKTPVAHPGVVAPTTEVIDGRDVHEAQTFRAFPTLAIAFDFHAEHLATSHWLIGARTRLAAGDLRGFCQALGGGTAAHPSYSTDPDYGASLWAVITDSDLTRFDSPAR